LSYVKVTPCFLSIEKLKKKGEIPKKVQEINSKNKVDELKQMVREDILLHLYVAHKLFFLLTASGLWTSEIREQNYILTIVVPSTTTTTGTPIT
jgi:hypothetical protein